VDKLHLQAFFAEKVGKESHTYSFFFQLQNYEDLKFQMGKST